MSRPDKISPNIIGHKVNLGTYDVNHKDFILYALGIGFSSDPLNTSDFKYTYELNNDFKRKKLSYYSLSYPCLMSRTGKRT